MGTTGKNSQPGEQRRCACLRLVGTAFVLFVVHDLGTAQTTDCQHVMVGGSGPCVCPAHARNTASGECACDDGYHEENGRHGPYCALGAPACEANAHRGADGCECDRGYGSTGGADQYGNPRPECERTSCANQVSPSWDANLNCCADTYEADGSCDEPGSGCGTSHWPCCPVGTDGDDCALDGAGIASEMPQSLPLPTFHQTTMISNSAPCRGGWSLPAHERTSGVTVFPNSNDVTYPPSLACSWLIECDALQVARVFLKPSLFATERGADYVEIIDSRLGRTLARLSGRLGGGLVAADGMYIATSGSAEVTFTSDANVVTSEAGFQFEYECEDVQHGATHTDQTVAPSPPSPSALDSGISTSRTCTSGVLAEQTSLVATACGDTLPQTCTTTCAAIFVPFFTICNAVLASTSGSSSFRTFEEFETRCIDSAVGTRVHPLPAMVDGVCSKLRFSAERDHVLYATWRELLGTYTLTVIEPCCQSCGPIYKHESAEYYIYQFFEEHFGGIGWGVSPLTCSPSVYIINYYGANDGVTTVPYDDALQGQWGAQSTADRTSVIQPLCSAAPCVVPRNSLPAHGQWGTCSPGLELAGDGGSCRFGCEPGHEHNSGETICYDGEISSSGICVPGCVDDVSWRDRAGTYSCSSVGRGGDVAGQCNYLGATHPCALSCNPKCGAFKLTSAEVDGPAVRVRVPLDSDPLGGNVDGGWISFECSADSVLDVRFTDRPDFHADLVSSCWRLQCRLSDGSTVCGAYAHREHSACVCDNGYHVRGGGDSDADTRGQYTAGEYCHPTNTMVLVIYAGDGQRDLAWSPQNGPITSWPCPGNGLFYIRVFGDVYTQQRLGGEWGPTDAPYSDVDVRITQVASTTELAYELDSGGQVAAFGTSCNYHIEHHPRSHIYNAGLLCDAATLDGRAVPEGNGDAVIKFQAEAGKTYVFKAALRGNVAMYANILVYPSGALQHQSLELQAQMSSMFSATHQTNIETSDAGFGGGELIVGAWGGTKSGDVSVSQAFRDTEDSFRNDLLPKKYFPGQNFGKESSFRWTCPGTGLYFARIVSNW